MPNSLKAKLSKLRYKGQITDAEYKELIDKLNGHDRQILEDIRAEIVGTLYVDSLIFGELIDFKDGKISADDVIEEFNRVSRLEILKIIDKYREESDDDHF